MTFEQFLQLMGALTPVSFGLGIVLGVRYPNFFLRSRHG